MAISKSLPFQTWCHLQVEYIQKQPIVPETVLPIEIPVPDWDYWGLESVTNTFGKLAYENIMIDEHITSLLFGDCNQAMHTEPIEILLAALIYSFHEVFPNRKVPTVFNEGHGREPWDDAIDLSDTVGWFTTIIPLYVPAEGGDIMDFLRQTKDRRRKIPGQGLPYFTSRFLTTEGKKAFAHHSQMEVMFNYFGRYQQLEKENGLFRAETLNSHAASGAGDDVHRLALFEIAASVLKNKLQINFSFNSQIRQQAAIRQWVNIYHRSLSELVLRLAEASTIYTLSDFPHAVLTYASLAVLQNECLPRIGLTDLDDVEDVYPCSPIQQGILTSQMKSPTTYQIRQICEIRALHESMKVDVQRLANAWQKVVNRHAMLRTIFTESLSGQGLFDQIVLKRWNADIMQLEVKDEEEAILAQITELPQMSYKDNKPCHRLAIYITKSKRIYICLDISHALVDASSLQLIVRELVQAYDGYLASTSGPLYSSYIAYLQRNSDEKDLDYWRTSLSDAQPCYLPGASLNTVTGASKAAKPLVLTTPFTDMSLLHKVSEMHGITIANIFQLAWGLVLARYTGLKEVLFGYLTNGRDVPIKQVEDMVGPLINMMVCNLKLNADMIVSKALQETQERFLEGFGHQRCSLADIQHSLQLSGHALFNTAMSYKRELLDTQKSASVAVELLGTDDPTEYDVMVNIMAGKESVIITLQYSPSFMCDELAKRLLSNFCHAVSVIVRDESKRIGEIEVVSPGDVEQIRNWNSKTPTGVHACIHELVREQTLLRPDAPAVCAWDGELTYGELDEVTDRLAHHLVGQGVGPEVMVGLCFEKSMWAVVAMLAVLKAGGAVVSVGTQHPIQRVEGILEDIEARVMLVGKEHTGRFADLVPHVVTVDASLVATLPVVVGHGLFECETTPPSLCHLHVRKHWDSQGRGFGT